MARKKKEPTCESFVIRMKCTVEKEVVVDCCTREQAETNPWDYATSENEVGQDDWEIISIEENL